MRLSANIVAPVLLASSVFITSCATKAEKVTASYVSPVYYNNFSCNQLSDEAGRVSARVQELTGAQNKKATDDAVATGVAIVIFWPAAFLVGGNDQTTAELGRMKGEMDAIEQASIKKRCKIRFQRS